ncbi:MAG: sugar phosphate nucleotidyltransferase [Chloroflexota bacterium]|nr:sugar phosphate nucleotidyltransferase [Chloroflexota bacterium]
MQGVILAAGKGSRLHPITTKRSKAMLPILGRPIVERVLEGIQEGGVHDFILVVSRDNEEIRRYFEEECQLDVNIRFAIQEERLGMADALSCAAPFIHEDFVLSSCDNLVAPAHVGDLIRAWRVDGPMEGLISLRRVDRSEISKLGIVALEGERVVRIVEKPHPDEAPSNIASLPLYIFTPRILDYLPLVSLSERGEYELQDAIQMLIDDHREVRGLFTEGRLTLTGPEDLLTINRHYLVRGHDRPQLAPFTVGPGTHLITPLRIEGGTVIGSGCVIGPRVYIERDCRIGDGVTIKDAVLLRSATVEDHAMVIGEVVS